MKYSIEQSTLTAIGDSIRAKSGLTEAISPLDMPSAIASISSGGETMTAITEKDINFYDYDGTLLHSYTLDEAHKLTELPEAPKHDGLYFQGWNWTLDKINVLNKPMNIGANYITSDGKTKLRIRIYDTVRCNVPLYFSQSIANGVIIDWGDGSDTESFPGTGYLNTSHQYDTTGDYIISLTVADGCSFGFGKGENTSSIIGARPLSNILYEVNIGKNISKIAPYSFSDCYSLSRISIPDNVVISNYAFQFCHSLKCIIIPECNKSIASGAFYDCYSLAIVVCPEGVIYMYGDTFYSCYALTRITIPNSVTSMFYRMFYSCYCLTNITIPDGVNKIENNMFNNCYCLTNITIPDSVTNISDRAFYNCSSLASITIPVSVTSIANYAFGYCSSVKEYHLKPTTPPTLSNKNAFNGIPSDCIVYVPKGCLETYQSATNWSNYAKYMVEEE